MLRLVLKLSKTPISHKVPLRGYNHVIGNIILEKQVYSQYTRPVCKYFSNKASQELDFGEFIPLFDKKMTDYYVREQYAVIFNLLKDGTQFKLTKEDVGDLSEMFLRHFCQTMVNANEVNPVIPTHRIILPILRYFVDYPYTPGDWMRYNLAVSLDRYASTDEERKELMLLINDFDEIDFMQGRHLLAKAYYEGRHVKQNFVAALAVLEVNVRTGYMPSIVQLAKMLRDGNGVTPNHLQAAELFISAGLKGDPEGYLLLAELFQQGKGVEKSEERALHYFKKAAEQKSKVATHNVGCAYFVGKGCIQSYKKALNYFRSAAELGNPLSQINLGNMYYNGLGVKVDLNEARKWYVKASVMKHEALDLVKVVDEKLTELMEEKEKV